MATDRDPFATGVALGARVVGAKIDDPAFAGDVETLLAGHDTADELGRVMAGIAACVTLLAHAVDQIAPGLARSSIQSFAAGIQQDR